MKGCLSNGLSASKRSNAPEGLPCRGSSAIFRANPARTPQKAHGIESPPSSPRRWAGRQTSCTTPKRRGSFALFWKPRPHFIRSRHPGFKRHARRFYGLQQEPNCTHLLPLPIVAGAGGGLASVIGLGGVNASISMPCGVKCAYRQLYLTSPRVDNTISECYKFDRNTRYHKLY